MTDQTLQYSLSAAACLSRMRDRVARMGGLTEAQMSDAATALTGRDSTLAQQVVQADKAIDALEAEVEQLMITGAGAPDAGAAEWVEALTLIRIASDLERVGDYAKNISKRTLVINSSPAQQVVQGLGRMMRAVQAQLGQVLDALSAGDAAKARLVWQQDGAIDELNNALFAEITSLMMASRDAIVVGTHFLFIAKNLERIGDHCTNIAELVYASIEGAPLDDRPKADRTSLTLVTPRDEKDDDVNKEGAAS